MLNKRILIFGFADILFIIFSVTEEYDSMMIGLPESDLKPRAMSEESAQLSQVVTELVLPPPPAPAAETVKIDKYAVQEWAIEPLKQLRKSTENTSTLNLTSIEVLSGRQELQLNLEGDSSQNQLVLNIYQNGIVYFKKHNPKNTWDFQVDDVVGQLTLVKENLETNVTVSENIDSTEFEIRVSGSLLLRLQKSPFRITLVNSISGSSAIEIDAIVCDGVVSAKSHVPSTSIYGIPEHPDHFNLVDTSADKPYRLYNLDRYLWPIHSKGSLYGTAPILVAHNSEQTSGIFWRNTTETYVDVLKDTANSTSHVTWLSEQGELEFLLFADSNVEGFYKKLADTIGYSLVPQLFALGYQHSRYSFKDQDDVQTVDEHFDQLGIPYDVIYLDIDHCYKKRYFSFNRDLYPEVDLMIKRLEKKGRKIVTIVDPHVLIDPEYYVYSESQNKLDYFIKNPDQTDFTGTCWPGPCHWLDFLNEDVRNYWASLYAYSKYEHSTPNFYTWNDMNEPAVFKGIEETMIKENIHTVKVQNGRQYQVPHTFAHNLYGYSQVKASYEGLVNRDAVSEQKRPLVLTRSWWVGSQKYAAIWTADSEAKWEYLQIHTPMLLTFSSVGFPYCGADVGGFEGNPSEELHVRWYQAGAFQPFFRGHSSTFCDRREPWLYSDDTCQKIRRAIRTRYEFLAVWYAGFFHHSTSGMPVMRALWQNYPGRSDLFAEEQVYMIGRDILVAPVIGEGQKSVTLPSLPGKWYDYQNGYSSVNLSEEFDTNSLDKIPVFFRGGSAILLYSILENETTYRSSEDIREKCPLQLILSLDEAGSAEGKFFMDDGQSFKFQKEGQFCETHFKFDGKTLNITVTSKFGDEYWKTHLEKIVICGLEGRDSPLTVQGFNINLNKSSSIDIPIQ